MLILGGGSFKESPRGGLPCHHAGEWRCGAHCQSAVCFIPSIVCARTLTGPWPCLTSSQPPNTAQNLADCWLPPGTQTYCISSGSTCHSLKKRRGGGGRGHFFHSDPLYFAWTWRKGAFSRVFKFDPFIHVSIHQIFIEHYTNYHAKNWIVSLIWNPEAC